MLTVPTSERLRLQLARAVVPQLFSSQYLMSVRTQDARSTLHNLRRRVYRDPTVPRLPQENLHVWKLRQIGRVRSASELLAAVKFFRPKHTQARFLRPSGSPTTHPEPSLTCFSPNALWRTASGAAVVT
jgi:hypothetical protein